MTLLRITDRGQDEIFSGFARISEISGPAGHLKVNKSPNVEAMSRCRHIDTVRVFRIFFSDFGRYFFRKSLRNWGCHAPVTLDGHHSTSTPVSMIQHSKMRKFDVFHDAIFFCRHYIILLPLRCR